MLSSPFWMTTKTSSQLLSLARLPADSQYCLRQSIPSLAHGAPRSASSSSEMLMVVDDESTLCTLLSSSSCASRMIVCERFDAKPKVGLRKDELDPYIACSYRYHPTSRRAENSYLMGGSSKAGRRADTAINTTIAAVRTNTRLHAENGLYATDAATLECGEPVRLSAQAAISHHPVPSRAK